MTEIVTIDSLPYDVYRTVEQADQYLIAKFGTTWFSLTELQKKQALISSTRLIDRQCWKGSKTQDYQPLAWPRKETGIADVEDDVVPDDISNASIELADAISAGSTVADNPTPGVQGIQSLQAGSVSLSFFRGAEGVLGEQRFPQIVQELVRKYTCGAGGLTVVGKVTGVTDAESVTNDDFGYSRGI